MVNSNDFDGQSYIGRYDILSGYPVIIRPTMIVKATFLCLYCGDNMINKEHRFGCPSYEYKVLNARLKLDELLWRDTFENWKRLKVQITVNEIIKLHQYS